MAETIAMPAMIYVVVQAFSSSAHAAYIMKKLNIIDEPMAVSLNFSL